MPNQVYPVGTAVVVEGELYGVVVDYEPASRIGDHSRHVIRLNDGSLISTDAQLVDLAAEAPRRGTHLLEVGEPDPGSEHVELDPEPAPE